LYVSRWFFDRCSVLGVVTPTLGGVVPAENLLLSKGLSVIALDINSAITTSTPGHHP
jgi:hypothetical protein